MTGKSCKAEVRWYRATDGGLVDVRLEVVDLWGLDSEIMRWNEIRKDKINSMLLDIEVLEMVFTEDWPAKACVRHLERIGSISS